MGGFNWSVKSNFHLLWFTIGVKNSRYFFIQSEIKSKPIVARVHEFSRVLPQLHVIQTSSFDWFIGLSTSIVIGQGDNFGFVFKTQLKTS